MGTVVGITLVKRFTYRGDENEEWSNTYHFTGDVPADSSAWMDLIEALYTEEISIYTPRSLVTRAYGYDSDADDATAVFKHDFRPGDEEHPGNLMGWGALPTAPGDSAGWVRWKTSRLNSNDKPIYLRKYFHDMIENALGEPDKLWTEQRDLMLAFGDKLRDGSFIDGRTLRSRLHDDTLVGSSASQYLTTRTLKRRGKRPGS